MGGKDACTASCTAGSTAVQVLSEERPPSPHLIRIVNARNEPARFPGSRLAPTSLYPGAAYPAALQARPGAAYPGAALQVTARTGIGFGTAGNEPC